VAGPAARSLAAATMDGQSSPSSALTATDILAWTGLDVNRFANTLVPDLHRESAKLLLGTTGNQLFIQCNSEELNDFLEKALPKTSHYLLVSEEFMKLRAIVAESQQGKESVIRCESDYERLERQFTAEYKDPSNLVARFLQYLNLCLSKFKASPRSYFAPCIALIQSSGYGKSRLLREVANHYPTIYFNFRNPRSTGYPPRTYTACAQLFETPASNRREYQQMLKQRILALVQRAVTLRDRLLEDKAPKPLIGEVDVSKRAMFPSERYAAQLFSRADTLQVARELAESTTVVLVFDEARECLQAVEAIGVSQFQLIHQALRDLSCDFATRHYNIMSVFVDTSFRIQNFSREDEPTARQMTPYSEQGYLKAFPPFILCGTFDLHLQQLDLRALNHVASSEYLRAGRPLIAQESYAGEYDFLRWKLFCGKLYPDIHSETGSLAAMLCRLAAAVSPSYSVATDLVADHMATLLACDSTHTATLSAYVAEPKLAIAAALLWQDEEFFTLHGVPALLKSLLSGALSDGVLGELVAQIILLVAFDGACRSERRDPGSLVPLRRLVLELLPAGADDATVDRVVPEGLTGASVACCQFVGVDHELSRRALTDLAARHCGAAVARGRRGVDFVIPLLGDSGDSELGVMMIQASLRNNLKPQADQGGCGAWGGAGEELWPSEVFEGGGMDVVDLAGLDRNCVRICMHVGDVSPAACATVAAPRDPDGDGSAPGLSDRGAAMALQLFGLEPRCLAWHTSSQYVGALRRLVHGGVDLEAYLEDNASVDPCPDPGGSGIRAAWPFVAREAPVHSPAPSGSRVGKTTFRSSCC
jgi:hypothetical protein